MRKMNKQPKSIKKREADEQVERARMIRQTNADSTQREGRKMHLHSNCLLEVHSINVYVKHMFTSHKYRNRLLFLLLVLRLACVSHKTNSHVFGCCLNEQRHKRWMASPCICCKQKKASSFCFFVKRKL